MDYDSEMKKAIEDLESSLGIRNGFMDSLVRESDWAFCVQLHALIESATTFLLNEAIGKPALEKIISHIDLSHSRYGKVKFLESLDLLDSNERRFISYLSKLRNDLVHVISNVEFSFSDYVARMDKNQKESFFDAVGFACSEKILIGREPIPAREFALSNPKLAIWLSGIALLSVVYIQADLERIKRNSVELDIEFARVVRSNKPVQPSAPAPAD